MWNWDEIIFPQCSFPVGGPEKNKQILHESREGESGPQLVEEARGKPAFRECLSTMLCFIIPLNMKFLGESHLRFPMIKTQVLGDVCKLFFFPSPAGVL